MMISRAELITLVERRRGGRWMRGSGLLQHRWSSAPVFPRRLAWPCESAVQVAQGALQAR